MSQFKFSKLPLEGAYLIDNFYVGDNRGGFTKYFEKDIYGNAGIRFSVNETFASISAKNVIRGYISRRIIHKLSWLVSLEEKYGM